MALSLDDLNRQETKRHWSFGIGRHRCLASHLVRLQMKLMVAEMLHRIPGFTIEPGFRPNLKMTCGGRQLEALPLRW